ncbi:MAG: hypothetical protein ACPGNT_03305 [Rhodospirillales bacterium]
MERRLLGIEGIYPHQIEALLDRAEAYCGDSPSDTQARLAGLRIGLLIADADAGVPITPVLSGALARSGAEAVVVVEPAWTQGGPLTTVADRLESENLAVAFTQHPHAGAALALASRWSGAVINIQDGPHEAPLAALAGVLALRRRKGHLGGLTIRLTGTPSGNAMARSLTILLSAMGAVVQADERAEDLAILGAVPQVPATEPDATFDFPGEVPEPGAFSAAALAALDAVTQNLEPHLEPRRR